MRTSPGRAAEYARRGHSRRFRAGEDPDPRAKYVAPVRMSFMYPEVRQERRRILQELLTRHETDGVEVHTEVLPICKYSQVEECVPLLTQ